MYRVRVRVTVRARLSAFSARGYQIICDLRVTNRRSQKRTAKTINRIGKKNIYPSILALIARSGYLQTPQVPTSIIYIIFSGFYLNTVLLWSER